MPDAAFPDEAVPMASTVQDEGQEGLVELHAEEPDLQAWREDFIGLLTIGAIRGWFDWCGHRIKIRTLTSDEELLIADLIREFEGTLGGTKAYATAVAGLCVEAVDGRPMPVPLGEHPGVPHQWALERFNYARRWYGATVDAILDGYLQLEQRQREAIAALGKASGPGAAATPGLSARSA